MSNKQMKKKMLRSVDDQIDVCVSNISTWYTTVLKLIEVGKSLSGSGYHRALKHNAKLFLNSTFVDVSVSDVDSEEVDDSDAVEISEDNAEDKSGKTNNKYVGKAPKSKRSSKAENKYDGKVEELESLTKLEQEQQALNDHMMGKRKEMQKTMEQPAKSKNEIKFTLEADPTKINELLTDNTLPNVNSQNNNDVSDSVSGGVLDLDVQDGEEVLSEEIFEEIVIEGIAPEIKMPILEKPTLDTNLKDVVKFRTPDLEPPPVNALTRLSPDQRDELSAKFYQQAKEHVLCQIDTTKTTKEKIDELIRRETDRLLQTYIKTH
jgi:hypothetical protein